MATYRIFFQDPTSVNFVDVELDKPPELSSGGNESTLERFGNDVTVRRGALLLVVPADRVKGGRVGVSKA